MDLRSALFFWKRWLLVLNSEETVEKDLILIFNRNASLNFFIDLSLLPAHLKLDKLTILLLIFTNHETFLHRWLVTRIVSPLLVHDRMHRSLVSIIAFNPFNWSVHIFIYVLWIDATLAHWECSNTSDYTVWEVRFCFAFTALDWNWICTLLECCMSRLRTSMCNGWLYFWRHILILINWILFRDNILWLLSFCIFLITLSIFLLRSYYCFWTFTLRWYLWFFLTVVHFLKYFLELWWRLNVFRIFRFLRLFNFLGISNCFRFGHWSFCWWLFILFL